MNRVILMGRLTADPELRQTPQGTAVTRFTIAVDRRYRREGSQNADFITCVAWRQSAEFICRYFQKGRMIAIEGQLQTRTWDGQDGRKNYVTEVIVNEAHFTGDRRDGGNTANNTMNNQMSGISKPDSDGFLESMDDSELPF